ncbi:MAG: alpha/beta hydrolase family protein [Myxococcota bacterium]
MRTRWIQGVAVIALGVALVGIRHSTHGAAAYPITLPGSLPATLYEPGARRGFAEIPADRPPLPTLILAHGFSANRSMLDLLARRVARAGYAVLTFDFQGHGANPHPFEPVGRGRAGLVNDFATALRYVRSDPRLDATRIAIAGHSMGAATALRVASYESGLAAVIGISGGASPEGPYPVQNLLLIWASGDPSTLRVRLRELGAHLAGFARLVADRTYGDVSRGEAIRVSEVAGTDHVRILWSAPAARRILAWLETTVGPGLSPAANPLAPGPGPWVALGLAAVGTLLWGFPTLLASVVRTRAPRPIDDPLRRVAMGGASLLIGGLLLLGAHPRSGGGPLAALPLVAGREVAAFFAVSGASLCLLLARSPWGRAALGRPRTSLPTALAAGGLAFGLSYLLLAGIVAPYLELGLAPRRLLWWGLCSVAALPFFLATEVAYRGSGRAGRWLPLGFKILTILALGSGAASGVLPRVVGLALGGVVALFALLEWVAFRLGRAGHDPWVAALFQSFWIGLFLAGFPLEV